MSKIETSAWVIHKGPIKDPGPAELRLETITIDEVTDDEVLVEPIYGCWEGNMAHALERSPVDICRQRGEDRIVLGNAAVVRILKTGSNVKSVREGDLCALVCIGTEDRWGNMIKVLGYDAVGSVGMMAKRVKLLERQVARLPVDSRFSPQQWAAFTVRYTTAWANWKLAWDSYRLQVGEDESPAPHVWGWGGGVAFGELALAKLGGCRVAMLASKDERLKLIREHGIEPIDRRPFGDLAFDEERFAGDRAYKRAYARAVGAFMKKVREVTNDDGGVAIFIDNIGQPVFRATVKATRIQGVIATVGWKEGMILTFNRAVECMSRHTYVHTHGCRRSEGIASMHFAEESGWGPPVDDRVYGWEEIPQLAEDFQADRIASYFPIFEINPL